MSNYGGEYDYSYGGDTGQGFMPNTSPDKTDKKGVYRNKNTILPLTLSQLLKAKHELPSDQHYKVDGKELVYGRIVGRIVQMEDDATQCRFTIVDGTTHDAISLSLYTTQTDPVVYAARRVQLPNSLAEVTFQSRAGSNTNQITVLDIRPISDCNVVTHHILDVINTHLFNTRGPLPRGGQQQHGSNIHAPESSISNVARGAMLANDMFSSSSSVLVSSSFASNGGNLNDHEYILELYRQNSDESNENGASVREIAKLISRDPSKRHITFDVLVKISEELLMDGRIYSTVDEEHFKTTS